MIEMDSRVYVDFHVLQTVPPSCVNRDDTGSPKTAVYGGTTRARVSSQAWKRAMRLMFEEIFPRDQLGVRTKHIVNMVADALRALDPTLVSQSLIPDARAVEMATMALSVAGLKINDDKKGNKITDALFFMSYAQARTLAEVVLRHPEKLKGKTDAELTAALRDAPSVDMVLFGRMVAADPSLNYDAAAQVAHCISTHTVHNEYDYFTAMDDLSPEDTAGAAHLDTTEYNSSTLYRYATVNVAELYRHLRGDTPDVVRGFAEAFIRAIPTGKQNSFANRTLPNDVYVAIRRDQPVNFAPAFEKAVRADREGGYVSGSEAALCKYGNELYDTFAPKPVLALGVGKAMNGLGAEVMPLNQMLDTLANWITENVVKGGGD